MLGIWNATPKQGYDFVLALLAVIGLIFLPGFALFITCFRETFAEYEVDENGVIKRLFAVRKRILWREVSYIGLNGAQNYARRTIRIEDILRNALVLYPSLIVNGSELSSKIEPFCEPHIEERYKDFTMNEPSCKMNSAVAYLMFYFGLIFFVIVAIFISLVNQQTPAEQALQPIPNLYTILLILSTFGSMGMGCFLYGLKLLTNRITLTPTSIIETHLFKTVEIPFSELQTFYSVKMTHQGGSSLQYSLRASQNRGILITPSFTDHKVLIAILKEQTKDLTLISGEAFAERDKRIETRRIIGFISLLFAILMSCCVGTGIWKISASQKRLHQYDILEREGRKEQGIVKSKIVKESRRHDYFIAYHFETGGKLYEASSPVTRKIYDSLKSRDSVSLIYQPNHPATSRLSVSIGKRLIQSDVFEGWVLLATALILFPIMYWQFFEVYRKRIAGKTDCETISGGGETPIL